MLLYAHIISEANNKETDWPTEMVIHACLVVKTTALLIGQKEMWTVNADREVVYIVLYTMGLHTVKLVTRQYVPSLP